MFPFKSLTFSTVAAISLAGCGGAATDGTLSLSVTDAPVDNASHVWIQFAGVELHNASGTESFTFDQPKRLDLLTLQGSTSAPLLDSVSLAAGSYQWIRLMVDAGPDHGTASSIVLTDGSEHALTVPSGSETGLKLVRGFTIAQGGSADFTIDFDLRKSVVSSANGYTLKPTLRVVDNAVVGHVAGEVDETLMSTHSCTEQNAAVYLFAGADAAFDDVGSAQGPLASSLVRYDESNSRYGWKVGFVEPGVYTVGLTCQANLDDPETNDTIIPVGQANVTVVGGATARYDFQ